MTLILDSGGVSGLAGQRARLVELRARDLWPPIVPAVVLVESLTGDHRRDYHTNRFLRMCVVAPIDDQLARDAARIRTATGCAGEIAATDAIVVALAMHTSEPHILTSDTADIASLVAASDTPIAVTAT